MSLDEFLSKYRRRSLETMVDLLRESKDLALRDLGYLLTEHPELRHVRLAELFEDRPAKPAPSHLSVAARLAAYLLDAAVTAGKRERDGLLVKLANYTQIGERLGATRDSVALALAIFQRRDLITIYPRRAIVRDLSGLALVAERPASHL